MVLLVVPTNRTLRWMQLPYHFYHLPGVKVYCTYSKCWPSRNSQDTDSEANPTGGLLGRHGKRSPFVLFKLYSVSESQTPTSIQLFIKYLIAANYIKPRCSFKLIHGGYYYLCINTCICLSTAFNYVHQQLATQTYTTTDLCYILLMFIFEVIYLRPGIIHAT